MRQDGLVSSNPASTAIADDVPVDVEAGANGAAESVSPQVSGPGTADAPPTPGPVVVIIDEAATGLARAAAEAEAGNPSDVGEFLVALAEDDVAITATFRAKTPGYQGWQWSVTIAVLDERHPTVSEVVLLPGDGALLAPAWIPWDERIRPGDLGVGDLLPPIADDPRIVPAYLQSDDPAVEAVATEVGLGRERVLSREGRVDFAERLHDGRFGPGDEMALAAPAHCVTCAFYLPLAGSLGQLLGACGNDLSPADGRVVDSGYGCGAHSETVIVMPARSAATDTVIDELALEVHRRPELAGEVVEVVDDGALIDDAEVVDDVDLIDDAEVTDAVDVADDLEVTAEVEPDEFADPYIVGAELAEAELEEAALLDADAESAADATASPGVPD